MTILIQINQWGNQFWGIEALYERLPRKFLQNWQDLTSHLRVPNAAMQAVREKQKDIEMETGALSHKPEAIVRKFVWAAQIVCLKNLCQAVSGGACGTRGSLMLWLPSGSVAPNRQTEHLIPNGAYVEASPWETTMGPHGTMGHLWYQLEQQRLLTPGPIPWCLAQCHGRVLLWTKHTNLLGVRWESGWGTCKAYMMGWTHHRKHIRLSTPKVLSRELWFPHGRSYQQNTCVKSRPQRWELGILMSLSYFQLKCRWNQIKSGKRIRATRLGLPGWGTAAAGRAW